jgi:hypothetical protein
MKPSDQPVVYTTSENGRVIFPLHATTIAILALGAVFVIVFAVVVGVMTMLLGPIGNSLGMLMMIGGLYWGVKRIFRGVTK